MITKLKWLKAYFTRDILPADGATIGKVLYTAKNATGRRIQYVIDMDADNMDVTNIDASPADVTTLPGAVIVTNDTFSPKTETSLYGFGLGATMPKVVRASVPAEFSQDIANGAAITAINVLTGCNVTDYTETTAVATTTTTVISVVAANGLTLNTTTGAVTLDDNLTADTYTVDYKIANKKEPSVFITGTITVIVQA